MSDSDMDFTCFTVYHTSDTAMLKQRKRGAGTACERDKKEIGRENNSGEGMQRRRCLKRSFPYRIMGNRRVLGFRGEKTLVITVLIVTVVVKLWLPKSFGKARYRLCDTLSLGISTLWGVRPSFDVEFYSVRKVLISHTVASGNTFGTIFTHVRVTRDIKHDGNVWPF